MKSHSLLDHIYNFTNLSALRWKRGGQAVQRLGPSLGARILAVAQPQRSALVSDNAVQLCLKFVTAVIASAKYYVMDFYSSTEVLAGHSNRDCALLMVVKGSSCHTCQCHH